MPARQPSERTAAFQAWFDQHLKDEGLRNADLQRRLEKVGARGRWGSGVIAGYRTGAALPSETACMYLAKALGLPITEVLDRAGYTDAAELIAEIPVTGSVLDELHERTRDLDPEQRRELETRMLAQIAEVYELADLRAEVRRLEDARRQNEADGTSVDAP